MSECIFDMTALSHLRDSIVDIIKHQTEKELEPSKKLLQRIDERALVGYFFLSFSLFYPLPYSLSILQNCYFVHLTVTLSVSKTFVLILYLLHYFIYFVFLYSIHVWAKHFSKEGIQSTD